MLLTERMISLCAVVAGFCSTGDIGHQSKKGASPCKRKRLILIASDHDDLSQASVRFGQPEFFSTYSLAASSSIGRTLSLIGWIQSEIFTHLAPSHCCI